MKTLLSRLRRPPSSEAAAPRPDDAGFFATQLMEREDSTQLLAPWRERAPELGARPHDLAQGLAGLVQLLRQDAVFAGLEGVDLAVLGGYVEFVQMDSGKQIIGQDEQGDFLVILLQGVVADDRLQPSGVKVRINESRAGDVLGELSVLDGGTRFCSCTALTPLTAAVLSSQALEAMMNDEPRLAAAVLAWLAKRLSLRLRQVSARLSVQLSRAGAAE